MNAYKLSGEEEPKLLDSLTPGTSDQVAPVAPPIPAPPTTAPQIPTPPIAPATAPKPTPQLPGMPPSITPDQIASYVQGQKAQLNKFGPQQQVDLEKNLVDQRNSFGNRLTSGLKGFGDALMMGVARAGDPGWQQQFESQQDERAREQMDVLQKAHGQQTQDVEAGMSMDMTDPASPISRAYRDSFAPIFAKMGYSAKDIEKMSASQVSTVADIGVRFADAQTQLELKKALLGVETLKAGAEIQNQRSQRSAEAAKALEGRGAWRRFVDVLTPTGRASTSALKKELAGEDAGAGSSGPYGPSVNRGGVTYDWSPISGKYHKRT